MRVQKAVAELGYQRHPGARSLRERSEPRRILPVTLVERESTQR
jgi:DNA-binding LacI/PurR family transcriptional regulator